MTNERKPVFNDDEDDLVRCRRVREELSRRFKTLDEAFAYFQALDRKYGIGKRGRAAARTAKRKPRARARAAAHKATPLRSGR
ncbi:MAG: hypothetical protein NTW87_35185 [Planctomycetota bacterium]|nr:hypothetical protein [Planctomycetota bacterium]